MLRVASDYFGLVQDDKLKVEITDGIKFVEDSAKEGKKFGAILFDVDSKDTAVGMSCPPKQFIEPSVLKAVKNCVGARGIFVLNLVCRDKELRRTTLAALKSTFKFVYSYNLESDVNEVVFCTNPSKEITDHKDWRRSVKIAAENLNRSVKEEKLQNDDIVDVNGLVERLTIES